LLGNGALSKTENLKSENMNINVNAFEDGEAIHSSKTKPNKKIMYK